jgi:hypothetical protein
MAAIYTHIFHGSRLRALPANALRQAQEILCALWMFAVLAFSLVIAVGIIA